MDEARPVECGQLPEVAPSVLSGGILYSKRDSMAQGHTSLMAKKGRSSYNILIIGVINQ